ncbi:MAG: alkaline phosphatase D family protein [Parvibaculum sp.]|uniref:alkaline phosphatase D family protein n=1 Tax=Parvibaculum sp. TaxID=2024848 RepID=UPI003C7717FE
MAGFDRREFLKLFAATAGCFALSASPAPFVSSLNRASAAPGLYYFPQGLASGDPQPDAVMLWTRVAPLAGGSDEPQPSAKAPIDVYVQVAEDEGFTKLVVERLLRADPAADHTIRVLLRGLKPDTYYYYRFFAGSDTSPFIGRTRTAPPPGSRRPVRYAFLCCQNYEQGFFSALRRLVNDDIAAKPEDRIEFVLHLGDFIYEHTGDVPEDEKPARLIGPMPDGSAPWVPDGTRPWWQAGGQSPQTLADYRFLYKTYLMDADLQAARARFPFIHTWDDHEFTNDCWQAHDTYFGDGSPAQVRKLAANQAWFEYIPAVLSDAPAVDGVKSAAHDFRPAKVANTPMGTTDENLLYQGADNLKAISSLTIYRTVSWGGLLDLVITDLRSYRSAPVMSEDVKALIKGSPMPPVRLVKLLDAGRTAQGGNPPEKLTYAGRELPNPRRTAPPGTHMGGPQKAWFKATMKNSKARWRVWANSVPALSMRLDFSNLPFAALETGYLGTDGWQGYPGELRELMAFLKEEKIVNVVSCAGDYHTHASGLLPVDPDAEKISFSAVEFVTTGVSSGSMFSGAERASRQSAFFRRMVLIEEDGKFIENFNNTVVNGLRAGVITNYTNSPKIGAMFRNERASPGLSFVDSNSHGYGLATVTEDKMTIELVNVGSVSNDAGPQGSSVLRRTRFEVKPWGPGEDPSLSEPVFEGVPSFPFTASTT